MFTGLVEQLGKVHSVEVNDGGYQLKIDAGHLFGSVNIGESIAVNGCCLTVVEFNDNILIFDAGQETWSRTTMRNLVAGSVVNLERALKVGDRLGGHYVTGHIDGTGILARRVDDEKWSTFVFDAPSPLMNQMASKGSIAVDGISLTLVEVTDSTFSVALIPHTLEITTLGELHPGDPVNLETDVLAKYVDRQIHCADQ
ncbi:MAG: riboflavin synthase [Planctomycetota bacterium]|nr:riboflavin synthase [Planctomycetota bacterium]